jgi:hypothetical protein
MRQDRLITNTKEIDLYSNNSTNSKSCLQVARSKNYLPIISKDEGIGKMPFFIQSNIPRFLQEMPPSVLSATPISPCIVIAFFVSKKT